jgi:hypothetical protein
MTPIYEQVLSWVVAEVCTIKFNVTTIGKQQRLGPK